MAINQKTYRTDCTVFDGFRLGGHKSGVMCASDSYGCVTKDGTLAYGIGPNYLQIGGVDVVVPELPIYEFSFVPYNISIGCVSLPVVSLPNGVYCYDEGQKGFKVSLSAGSRVNLLPVYLENDLTSILLFTSANVWRMDTYTWICKIIDKTYSSPCIYGSRIFGVDGKRRLAYSGAYDRLKFEESADEGGYIDLWDNVGSIQRLLALPKALYIFFDRTIYRLTGEGAARDFKIEKVAYTGGEVYPTSAAVCGDGVVFLAKDGCYKIKGLAATPFVCSTSLQGLIPLSSASAAVVENNFVLPCQVEGGGEKMLSIDTLTGEVGYTKYSPVLACYDGGVYGVDKSGRMFSYQSGYPLGDGVFFAAKGLDLGNTKEKTLKSVRIYGQGSLTIVVQNGYGKAEKQVELKASGTDVNLSVKGKTFDMTFFLQPNTVVTRLEAYSLRTDR